MADKCFCHLNGYKVKDADARKSIEDLVKRTKKLEDDLPMTESKGNEIEVLLHDNEFRTDSMILRDYNDLDLFVIENFEDNTGIDLTKDDGNYINVNNYDSENHCIHIPSGNLKMFRSPVVESSMKARQFFTHVETMGEGSVNVYFSTDGGVTFKETPIDEMTVCVEGTNLVVQFKLTGEITLHNVCWGVRF